MAKPSWKARRNGKIYCAPACGGRCTWAAHLTAKKKASAIARALGAGWKPRVSENLGWHWEVRHKSDCLGVSEGGSDGSYMALLGEGGPGGRWFGFGKTPDTAIANAIRKARNDLDRIKKVVEVVESNASRTVGTKRNK